MEIKRENEIGVGLGRRGEGELMKGVRPQPRRRGGRRHNRRGDENEDTQKSQRKTGGGNKQTNRKGCCWFGGVVGLSCFAFVAGGKAAG